MNLQVKLRKYSNGYSGLSFYFVEKFERLNRTEQQRFIEFAIEMELEKALRNGRLKAEYRLFLYSKAPEHIKNKFNHDGKGNFTDKVMVTTAI